jgi:two-component system phosphate regulon response regulator OmpR
MSSLDQHILIVDDDRRLRALLRKYLAENGYAVTEAASAQEARLALALLTVDVMVLDVMMPEETGLEFADSLSPSRRPPILMLTALDAPQDRIRGLEAGVEDYLTKPFEPRELLLRLSNILRIRRFNQRAEQTLRFGSFELNLQTGKLERAGEGVYLTGVETALLMQLAKQPSIPISREALAQSVGGDENSRGIDMQIARLRKKIEEDNAHPRYIVTARGEGYKLVL